MTKQQLIGVSLAMIITSVLVSAGTTIGGLWYIQQANENTQNSIFDGFALPSLFASEPVKNAPSFHPLEKIVLSVKGKKQTHFVMLELAIETRQPERMMRVDDYMPVVQNALLKMFANKHYDDLQQDGAIVRLQEEVKQALLIAFEKTDLVHDIDDVLLTKFVMQ